MIKQLLKMLCGFVMTFLVYAFFTFLCFKIARYIGLLVVPIFLLIMYYIDGNKSIEMNDE